MITRPTGKTRSASSLFGGCASHSSRLTIRSTFLVSKSEPANSQNERKVNFRNSALICILTTYGGVDGNIFSRVIAIAQCGFLLQLVAVSERQKQQHNRGYGEKQRNERNQCTPATERQVFDSQGSMVAGLGIGVFGILIHSVL